MSGKDMFRNSSLSELAANINTVSDSICLGLVIAKLFNSPFALCSTNGKVLFDDSEIYGYCVYGPLLEKFLIWLYYNSRKDGIDKLLFFARDGYFLEKDYKIASELLCDGYRQDWCYLPISRRLIYMAAIENEEDFTEEFLNKVQAEYLPEQVFIEYNGTWGMGTLMDMELPKHWVIVQQLATVDATTFDMYLANMRTMVMEQLFRADVVIFNRCDDSTDKGKCRRNVKAQNRKAQLVFEREDGSLDERPEELPFDLSADVIEITDADYAIWYMDCMDNPKKYEGKKVSFLALVYNPEKLKKGVFVPGRFAMTCCIEDVTFIGFKCKYADEDKIPHKSWLNITAEVHVEFAREYKGKGPVLYPVSIEPAEKPEDELVYFS